MLRGPIAEKKAEALNVGLAGAVEAQFACLRPALRRQHRLDSVGPQSLPGAIDFRCQMPPARSRAVRSMRATGGFGPALPAMLRAIGPTTIGACRAKVKSKPSPACASDHAQARQPSPPALAPPPLVAQPARGEHHSGQIARDRPVRLAAAVFNENRPKKKIVGADIHHK